MFSAIAGVALVLAAIFFLRYSIQNGWLQPPIRVLIGIAVAVALLVACELKAARQVSVHRQRARRGGDRHPVCNLLCRARAVGADPGERRVRTTRARDCAGGGVVDSPRVALHRGARPPRRLLDAYPVVDRREPADPTLRLPASAQRRTRVGRVQEDLAGAHRPDAGLHDALPVGMGVPVPARRIRRVAGHGHLPCLPAGDVRRRAAGAPPARWRTRRTAPTHMFERTSLLGAVVPVIFSLYLAAVPAYGARATLLFGFLLLVDLGLLAISVARRQAVLHTVVRAGHAARDGRLAGRVVRQRCAADHACLHLGLRLALPSGPGRGGPHRPAVRRGRACGVVRRTASAPGLRGARRD